MSITMSVALLVNKLIEPLVPPVTTAALLVMAPCDHTRVAATLFAVEHDLLR